MNPEKLHSLSEHIQSWAAKHDVGASDVIQGILVMAAMNAIQLRQGRKHWLDHCAVVYERAVKVVQVDNPLLVDSIVRGRPG